MASAADFTLTIPPLTAGEEGRVSLSRPSAEYVPRFTVCFDGVTEAVTLPLLSQSQTQLIYGFTPPLSWCEALPDAVSGEGTMRASIDFDSAIDGLDRSDVCAVEASFTVYVPEWMQSSAALTVEVVNDNAVAAQWGIALRSLSRLAYSVEAQAATGAAVEEICFCCGASELSGAAGTTPPLTAAGTLTPRAHIRDSRGRSITVESEAVTVWDYHRPTLGALQVLRCQEDGTVSAEGAYLKVSAAADCAAVGGRNRVTLSVCIRPVGGAWGAAVTLQSGVAHVLQADAAAVYEARFTAEDTLGSTAEVTALSGTAAVAFHLREGGAGAAFGKRAEADGFRCAWDAAFDGDVSVGGTLAAASLTVAGKPLLDLVYPVGAIYLSAVSASPAVLFGGTWEAIEGRFLLGCDEQRAALTSGGADSHRLTVAQLPSHTHRVLGYADAENVGHDHTVPNIRTGQSGEYGVYAETWGYGSGSRDLTTDFTDITHNHRVDITSQTAGSGAAFSLLPPYLAVYMWRRTA